MHENSLDIAFRLMDYDSAVRAKTGCTYLAGVDEVGRGSLAGPLAAAAVILPDRLFVPGLDDSKQLSARRRVAVAKQVAKSAVCWAISFVSPAHIDRIGLTAANTVAMQKAVANLVFQPQFVMYDGNAFSGWNFPNQAVVKGDQTSQAIAAAACLAKVVRDALMTSLGEELFPGYGWERNAGYATSEHRQAIPQLGITPLHRRLFLRRLLEVPQQASLPLEGA